MIEKNDDNKKETPENILHFNVNKNIEVRLGLRTLKTGLSVFITIIICELLNRATPSIAALASVFTLREDTASTWKFSKIRIFSNIVGAIVAVMFVYLYKHFPSYFIANLVLLPLGIILIIVICDALKFNFAIIGASSTFLVLLIASQDMMSIELVLMRVLDTFIGSFVSIAVNALIKPQKKVTSEK